MLFRSKMLRAMLLVMTSRIALSPSQGIAYPALVGERGGNRLNESQSPELNHASASSLDWGNRANAASMALRSMMQKAVESASANAALGAETDAIRQR